MNYVEAMEYIDELNKSGISLGLERMRTMLDAFGNPQQKLRCIHIAGTNGKGSVGAFISSALQKSGKKVGHYQSPTLFEYRDRIRINEVNISEEMVADLLSQIRERCQIMSMRIRGNLTSFEAETLMAFLYFTKMKCDYVVLEVGMGGRTDATNVISAPEVAVVTPISMDHSAFLGDTIEEIAKEKAGILKKDCPAVIGIQQNAVLQVLKEECQSMGIIPILQHAASLKEESWSLEGQLFSYGKWQHVRISLLGAYQPENACLALETLQILQKRDADITDEGILAGMQSTVWPGRFEILHRNPYVIVDGAHNPDGAKKLADSMAHFQGKKVRIAMGVFRDKDYRQILQELQSISDTICCFQAKSARGLECASLAEEAKQYFAFVTTADSARGALINLRNCSGPDDVILCCGSLSIVKEITESIPIVFEEKKPDKWNEILHHHVFRDTLKKIQQQEMNRIYCHHDLTHLLDVARIAWMLALEERIDVQKDVVYGAALLHDLGRSEQYANHVPHHLASIAIAESILKELHYSENEINAIKKAISFHGALDGETTDLLSELIYRADKLSRNCFQCEARTSCKWPVTQQNHYLQY